MGEESRKRSTTQKFIQQYLLIRQCSPSISSTFDIRFPLPAVLVHSGKRRRTSRQKGIPQFLLDIMPGYRTLMQGRWNERERIPTR
jgi:hypothetical protein